MPEMDLRFGNFSFSSWSRTRTGGFFRSSVFAWPYQPSLIIITTRPKPAYGRQGLAGSWGQDTDEVSTFWVFLTSHFAPAALSSDLNQPGTINDDKNPPGIIKTRPGAIKKHEKTTWNHEKPNSNYKKWPVTIKTDLEPWFTLKTHLEPRKTNLKPWKTIKTHLEPWKTNLEPWITIKTDLEQ